MINMTDYEFFLQSYDYTGWLFEENDDEEKEKDLR